MTMSPDKMSLRSRPLTISYNIPISKTLRFWEGLQEGKIYATRCRRCGELIFPPQADCPKCLSPDVDWVELSGEGELVTFTHVIVRPASFQDTPPYTVAVAELKEGVRVLAWLRGVPKSKVKVGLKVRLVAEVDPEGRLTYHFEPAG